MREVALASGIDELKQRLEVLLGAKAHAPADETEKQRYQEQSERLARRSRMAEAGGQLVAAAFAFLGEVIAQGEPTNGAVKMAGELKARLVGLCGRLQVRPFWRSAAQERSFAAPLRTARRLESVSLLHRSQGGSSPNSAANRSIRFRTLADTY